MYKVIIMGLLLWVMGTDASWGATSNVKVETKLPQSYSGIYTNAKTAYTCTSEGALIYTEKDPTLWRTRISGLVQIEGEKGDWKLRSVLASDDDTLVVLVEQVDWTKVPDRKYCVASYDQQGKIRAIGNVKHPLYVDFYSTKIGAIVKGRRILVTQDGGKTWTELAFKTEEAIHRACWISEKRLMVSDNSSHSSSITLDYGASITAQLDWTCTSNLGMGYYLRGDRILVVASPNCMVLDNKTGKILAETHAVSPRVSVGVPDGFLLCEWAGQVYKYKVADDKLTKDRLGDADVKMFNLFVLDGAVYGIDYDQALRKYDAVKNKFTLLSVKIELPKSPQEIATEKIAAMKPMTPAQRVLWMKKVQEFGALYQYVTEEDLKQAQKQVDEILASRQYDEYGKMAIDREEEMLKILTPKRQPNKVVHRNLSELTQLCATMEYQLNGADGFEDGYSLDFYMKYGLSSSAKLAYDKMSESDRYAAYAEYLQNLKTLRAGSLQPASRPAPDGTVVGASIAADKLAGALKDISAGRQPHRRALVVAVNDYLRQASPAEIKSVLIGKQGGKFLDRLREMGWDQQLMEYSTYGVANLADDLPTLDLLMRRRVVTLLQTAQNAAYHARSNPATAPATRPRPEVLPAPALPEAAVALAEAKSYYNLCSMKNTPAALQYLTEALTLAYPDIPEAVIEFRRQQLVGSTTQPLTPTAATQPRARAPEAYLTQIPVVAKNYIAALAQYKDEDYRCLTAKGNLLLLADQPEAAMALFVRAYKIAPEKELAPATENIARALRAQDGTIGRANSFVLAVRPPATQPAR